MEEIEAPNLDIPSNMTKPLDLQHQTALPQLIDIAIYIPARNEENEDRLTNTIASLRRNAHTSKLSIVIVVVDDGSTDHTGKIAEHLADYVITLPDRGYSALGLPELADTHNAGLQHIRYNYPQAKYIMVSGADTIYHDDYLRQIYDVMEDSDGEVAITGGQWKEGIKSAPRAVRGSGRLYSHKIMRLLEYELPKYYSWESYPLYLAQTMGYKTFAIDTALYSSSREPYQLIKWRNYGRGSYEIGFTLPYVFGRAGKLMLQRKFGFGLGLLSGYFFAMITRKKRYPKIIRKYVRSYQWKRILFYLSLKKVNLLKDD